VLSQISQNVHIKLKKTLAVCQEVTGSHLKIQIKLAHVVRKVSLILSDSQVLDQACIKSMKEMRSN